MAISQSCSWWKEEEEGREGGKGSVDSEGHSIGWRCPSGQRSSSEGNTHQTCRHPPREELARLGVQHQRPHGHGPKHFRQLNKVSPTWPAAGGSRARARPQRWKLARATPTPDGVLTPLLAGTAPSHGYGLGRRIASAAAPTAGARLVSDHSPWSACVTVFDLLVQLEPTWLRQCLAAWGGDGDGDGHSDGHSDGRPAPPHWLPNESDLGSPAPFLCLTR